MPRWKSSEKILWELPSSVTLRPVHYRKIRSFRGYPPPPTPLNALTGAGFAKSVCKILMSKNLEVKILTTQELGPLSRYIYTASALTMLRLFEVGGKVGCHMRPVNFGRGSGRQMVGNAMELGELSSVFRVHNHHEQDFFVCFAGRSILRLERVRTTALQINGGRRPSNRAVSK